MGCKVLCPSFALLAYLMICEHVRAQCTQPSFGSNNVVLTGISADGSTATFECMIGYKPVDSKASRSVTCKGNQWTNLDFTCTKKSCGPLPDIINGRYEMTGILFGDTAKPVCNQGYMLAGQETPRVCREKGWDGQSDPLCESVKCLPPPAIENGQLVDVPLDSYSYLQAVSYRCNEGFDIVGESSLFCSDDGNFKPGPPECFGGCLKPIIPNAIRISGRPPYKLKSTVEYKCEKGYTMKGESSITCEANGWNHPLPQCIVSPTTLTTAVTSRVHTTSMTLPKDKALPTTPTTAATSASSRVHTTSKALPEEKEETTNTNKSVAVGVGIGVSVTVAVVAGILFGLYKKSTRSKHQHSQKVPSDASEL
ncbi:hypothetical protein QQF64_021056 [Cirrhinus molitorella]|uniref:Uncharacterized protein n=2 Tax=Cirrhinus molitorella TaxID=172907 RepID=A0ABR3LD77_9TELE|nr:hypothetical protein Q8A67_016386 [Cirrhinus molitorella]